MSDGRFIPRSARLDGDAEREYRDALIPGVPEHLKVAVLDFIDQTTDSGDLSAIEVAMRVPIVREYNQRISGVNLRFTVSQMWRKHGDDWLLDLVDQRLYSTPELSFDYDPNDRYAPAAVLASMLKAGGSAHSVAVRDETNDRGDKRLALEPRVAPEVREAADRAMSHGKSGEHLRRAWIAHYSRNPSPSEAYGQAIKAVEVAARPVVTPKDSTATLGTIVGHMKAQPGSVELGLDASADSEKGKQEDVSGEQVSRMMMQMLWRGQTDRHGDPDPAAPISVSPEEAGAALHLAVLLVHWFETGVVRPAGT